jgi:hypothetical protein
MTGLSKAEGIREAREARGADWFNNLILQNKQNRIIIICSNNLKDETVHCNKFIAVEKFK